MRNAIIPDGEELISVEVVLKDKNRERMTA